MDISRVIIDYVNYVDIEKKDDLVDSICNYYEKYFGNFYKVFLLLYKEKIEEIFNETNIISFDKDRIIKSLLDNMYDSLSTLCTRTLIVDINSLKEEDLLKGYSSTERYNYYSLLLRDKEYIVKLLEKYPVLEFLIDKTIFNSVNMLREVMGVLDDVEIFTKEKASVINNITFSCGDTHNGGKRVIILETNVGKIMYKPHSLSADLLFSKLLDYINKSGSLKVPYEHIKTIDKDKYGWQEFIKEKECKNELQVSNYYYRIGVALCIFHALGCEDIHFENIIADGEYPRFIDLETLIVNRSNEEADREKNLRQMFNEEINNSVMGTLLLPLNLKSSLFDMDMGGISHTGKEKSNIWKSYLIEDEGTDNIRLEKKSILSGSSNSNMVKINGEIVNPVEYVEDIQKGFSNTYDIILDNKNDICKIIENSKVKVRQVLRATSVYSRFIEAATHPYYLESFELRANLLMNIKSNSNTTPELGEKEECEISAMFVGDVPYFETELDTCDLVANKNKKIEKFYKSNLKSFVNRKIASLNKDNLSKQLYYIRMSLSTVVKDAWLKKGVKEKYHERYFLKNNTFLDCAKEIGDFIYNNAIWKKDKATLVTTTLSQESNLVVSELNYNLYEGGGIIIFLLQLSKAVKDKKYEKLALSCLSSLEEIEGIDKVCSDNISIFYSAGSLLYIYSEAYKIAKDDIYLDKLEKLILKINQNDYKKCQLDIVGGISGVIILLLNIFKEYKIHTALNCAESLSEILYERLSNNIEGHFAGLAHGYSGYAWALIYMGSLSRNNRYIELGKRLIKEENKLFSESKGNWKDIRVEEDCFEAIYWCHGASGIILSRANIIAIYNENNNDQDFIDAIKKDIKCGLYTLLKKGFSNELDHCLCHGIFGNIDVLITISKLLGYDDLLEIAKKEALKAINSIKSNGIRTGMNNSFDNINFMIGLSGIGYELIRLDNKCKSILSLEI